MGEELPNQNGFESPRAVFAAYKKATSEQDWKALFALGTPARQSDELLDLVVSAALTEDSAFKALVAKHGGNWNGIVAQVTDADDAVKRIRLAVRIAKDIKDKAGLYAAAQDLISRDSLFAPTTVNEMRNFVQNDSAASAQFSETRVAVETQTDNLTKLARKIPRTVNVTGELYFRRIAGRWYLSLPNEAALSP